MATVTASVPVTSKTFRNYLTTREKKLEVDKNYIEKLNDAAFKKMKNEKLAEKFAKDQHMEKLHNIGKVHEKINNVKNR